MKVARTRLSEAAAVAPGEGVQFQSCDALLTGRLFRPERRPIAAVVVHAATGVPQRYYHAFAAWLADEGYACLTYDYRDFGASAVAHPRRSSATMADWGIRDQAAAQNALEELVPERPVWVIGHSLGGYMLPFQDGAARVSRLITVASGPVHRSDHRYPQRFAVEALWSLPVRWLTWALGYLPGRALRLGTDLPVGVYTEWRRWCTTRGFLLSDIGRSLPMPDWTAMKGQAKFVALADDGLIPPHAVWRLMQYYPEAVKRQLTLRPRDYGLGPVGHISAFAERNRALWPAILA